VDYRASDEAAVFPDSLGPVKPGEANPWLGEASEQSSEPLRLEKFRVIVEQAEELRLGCPPGPVERGDDGRV
jgi:hypothetical protein